MWKLGKITAKTHIGDYGQIVDSFVLLLKDTCCEEVKMTNGTDFILEKNYNDLTGKVNAKGVTEISICETEEGTEVELILDPFVIFTSSPIIFICGTGSHSLMRIQ